MKKKQPVLPDSIVGLTDAQILAVMNAKGPKALALQLQLGKKFFAMREEIARRMPIPPAIQ
jgi:hypothetical protein